MDQLAESVAPRTSNDEQVGMSFEDVHMVELSFAPGMEDDYGSNKPTLGYRLEARVCCNRGWRYRKQCMMVVLREVSLQLELHLSKAAAAPLWVLAAPFKDGGGCRKVRNSLDGISGRVGCEVCK